MSGMLLFALLFGLTFIVNGVFQVLEEEGSGHGAIPGIVPTGLTALGFCSAEMFIGGGVGQLLGRKGLDRGAYPGNGPTRLLGCRFCFVGTPFPWSL